MAKSLIKLISLDVHGLPEPICQSGIDGHFTGKELFEFLFVIAAKVIRILGKPRQYRVVHLF